jgi:cell wall assembly regulator SMI1
VVCGLAWHSRTTITSSSSEIEYRTTVTRAPAPRLSAYIGVQPVPAPAAPRRSSTDVCPESSGKVTPTRPSAATTARVNKAWQRIEKWLAAHAPASSRSLRSPATGDRIDALQRRMSVAFPADLVASLRRHDGVAAAGGFTLPPFYAPETLDGILGDWRVNCEVLADEDTDWTDSWWDRAFVPFGQSGDGGSLLIDQRAGGHGRVGEFYPEDGTSFDRWPASLAELLESTATSLETGHPYAGHYRPRVDADGALDWEIN